MWISNVSIRSKLLLILLFPMIGLIYFSVSGISEKYQLVREFNSIHEMTELSIKISALVHETQKEGGFTAAYLGSNGENFASELTSQYENTDVVIKEFEDFLTGFNIANFDTELENELSRARGMLSEITSNRKIVKVLNISTNTSMDAYSEMNSTFLNSIALISKMSTQAELTSLIFCVCQLS